MAPVQCCVQRLQELHTSPPLRLEYYRSYNASWFYPARYAAVVSDVNLHNLQTCADSVEACLVCM